MPRSACRTSPSLSLHGAGEAAPRVAKQLGLEQGLGDAAAVHGHEGAGTPRALRVKQPGDDFLASAGFAKDQHLGVGTGSRRDIVAKRDNAGAFTNEAGVFHPRERMRGL